MAAEVGNTYALRKLLAHGADIHSVDLSGRTALFWAAISGQDKSIEILIAQGASRTMEDASGRNALSYAAEAEHHDACIALLSPAAACSRKRGHEEMEELETSDEDDGKSDASSNSSSDSMVLSLKTLLKYGEEMYFNCAWEDEPNIIMVASKVGSDKILSFLLEAGFKACDAIDMRCRTPLILAAARGHDSIVRTLLSQPEMDADWCDEDGNTALDYARMGNHESTIQLLLDSSVEGDQPNATMCSPSSQTNRTTDDRAEFCNRLKESADPAEILTLLSSTGAKDDNTVLVRRRDAIFWAIENGNREVLDSVIAAFPSLANAQDDTQRSPLLLAVTQKRKDFVRALLALTETDVNSQDKAGHTSLSIAIRQQDLTTAHMLAGREGIDCTLNDADQMSSLLWAVSLGILSVTRMLVNQSNVDHQDGEGRSLLHHAILDSENHVPGHSKEEVLRHLLRFNVSVNVVDKNGRTPLSYAAEMGLLPHAKMLVNMVNIDINCADERNRTPISYAAEHDHRYIIALLLEKPEVNVTVASTDGRTPLSYASIHEQASSFELLFAAENSMADFPDENGRSPLSWAAQFGSVPVCSLLQALGSDINQGDKTGRTPLSYAAEMAQFDTVRLLLETGAEATSRDVLGRSSLQWAASDDSDCSDVLYGSYSQTFGTKRCATIYVLVTGQLGDIPTATSLDHLLRTLIERNDTHSISRIFESGIGNKIEPASELVHHAMEHGSDETVKTTIAALDGAGLGLTATTILSIAASAGRTSLVKQLLEEEIESKDADGLTPIAQAVMNGHLDTMAELLDNDKVNINACDNTGRTPLILASIHDQEEALSRLLHCTKIDVNHTDQEGRSSISHAAGLGHSGIVELLLEDSRTNSGLADAQGRLPLWHAVAGFHCDVIAHLAP
ncbi:hypothetical protein QQS21_007010 [Conoideocrella luteorostrata]|uniref:Ankyrin n=1 Tax=Conoideocrella luteorostrata TaxID=1105319 RepID=A0AAJ0CLJ7_9HYPO|nr:hypothetical protein QQS21_007010 [Conoideocrella luteorostrata]